MKWIKMTIGLLCLAGIGTVFYTMSNRKRKRFVN